MTTKAKIITALMGLICLAITLVFPSNSTLLSVAPVLVTFSAWIFISNNKKISFVEGFFMGLAILAIAACFVLGMAYDYSNGMLELKEGAVLFPCMDYIPVALALFFAALSLAVGEIVSAYRTNIKNRKENVEHTYNEIVNEVVVVSK